MLITFMGTRDIKRTPLRPSSSTPPPLCVQYIYINIDINIYVYVYKYICVLIFIYIHMCVCKYINPVCFRDRVNSSREHL